MLIKLVVAFTLLFFGISIFAEEPTFRKVKEGETFYRIAVQTFPDHISAQPDAVERLKALNPDISDVTKIKVGQKIIVSGKSTAVVASDQQEPTEQINENKVDLINEPKVNKVQSEEEVERQISNEEKQSH